MRVKIHLIASIVLAFLIFPYFKWASFFVIVGGVLIDIDHYFIYVLKKRKYSLTDAMYYFSRKYPLKNLKKDYFIFHNIELVIILVLLGYFSDLFFLTGLGLGVHLIMDYIHDKRKHNFCRNFSIIAQLSQ